LQKVTTRTSKFYCGIDELLVHQVLFVIPFITRACTSGVNQFREGGRSEAKHEIETRDCEQNRDETESSQKIIRVIKSISNRNINNAIYKHSEIDHCVRSTHESRGVRGPKRPGGGGAGSSRMMVRCSTGSGEGTAEGFAVIDQIHLRQPPISPE
jgi:hypothetical protein